jgi:hypothetical protein
VVKRNAIAVLLGFVALWPLAHRGLVARLGIDPWKLSGFAMYATPSLPVLVSLVVPERAGPAPLDEAALPAWVKAELDRFRVERLALGRLREPAAEARALLVARQNLSSLAVLVQKSTLDADTGRITTSTERYVYDRSLLDGGQPSRRR